MAECSSCGAQIIWHKTIKGRPIPLDPEPSERGNVIISEEGTALVYRDPSAVAPRYAAEPKYLSHFATCPNADHSTASEQAADHVLAALVADSLDDPEREVQVRAIVTGSRSWSDRGRIATRLAQIDLALPRGADPPVIVVGYDPETKRPKGVDELAYQEAQKLGLTVEPHPAHWEDEGKRAGFARNERMAKAGADLCIAFWDGRSHGTLDMITRAVTHGIPVDVVMKAN